MPSTVAPGATAGAVDAADAHGEPGREREPALEDQQVAGRQEGGVGDVEIAGADDGERSRERPVENEAAMIVVAVERALGEHDRGAGEPAARGATAIASSP